MFFEKNKQWLWKLIIKQSVSKVFVTVEIIKIDLYTFGWVVMLACSETLYFTLGDRRARAEDFLTARAREWCVRVLNDFRKGKENSLYVQAIVMLLA